MGGILRFIIGVAGGFAAAASKVLALDTGQLAAVTKYGLSTGISDEIRGTIFIVTPILMILGGLVAWATSEENRLKLLAIGCAAPAMIAPWTAHSPLGEGAAFLSPISLTTSAYAAELPPVEGGGSTVVEGLKVLFGLATPETQHYWVIAGSDADAAKAQQFADSINAVAPDLQAFVGKRQPDNEFYPIIVGGADGFLPYPETKALLSKASQLDIIRADAYLSNYADRLPSPSG